MSVPQRSLSGLSCKVFLPHGEQCRTIVYKGGATEGVHDCENFASLHYVHGTISI